MKRLLLLLLIILPGIVFAQATGGTTTGTITFTPSDTDVSYIILNSWYGLVDNVLPGGPSFLFGTLFGIFNSGVLALAGIIVMYTLMVSTLNTAHDGKILGEKFSSVWVPLRTVAGIALLIPKASGYSMIQIFMMWIAVQGVGLADSVWNTAVTYYLNGGVTISPIKSPSAFNSSGGSGGPVSNATDILRSLTCMYMLQTEVAAQRPTQTIPDFFTSVSSQFAAGSPPATGTIKIPGPIPQYGFVGGECGQVQWAQVNLPSPMMSPSGPLPQYQNIPAQIASSKYNAVQSLINSLATPAQQIVQNYSTLINPLTTSGALPLGGVTNSGTWGNPVPGSVTGTLFASGNVINNPATSYISALTPLMTQLQNTTPPGGFDNATAQTLTQGGWAVAGAVIDRLIKAANTTSSLDTAVASLYTTAPSPGLAQTPSIVGFFNACSACVGQINDIVNGSSAYTVGTSSPFITGATNYNATSNQANSSSFGTSVSTGGGDGDILLSMVLGTLSGIGDDISNMEHAVTNNSNPLLLAVSLGNDLVNDFMIIWTAGYGIAAGITVALAVVPSVNLSNPVNNILGWFMSFLMPFIAILFTAGITLTFYLPLIPYLLFTFGVIGWFITVLEAMVAAPLVAIGITHPEGHAILGKADPAVMLLVNVFLRPTLMIIGMFAGLSLSYAGLWLVDYGFGKAWSSVASSVQGPATAFIAVGCIVIYCIVAVTILQRSFSLVYIIPDSVFQWLSGGSAIKGMGGEAEMEGKVAGGVAAGAKIMCEQMQKKIGGLKAGGGGGKSSESGGESEAAEGDDKQENKLEAKGGKGGKGGKAPAGGGVTGAIGKAGAVASKVSGAATGSSGGSTGGGGGDTASGDEGSDSDSEATSSSTAGSSGGGKPSLGKRMASSALSALGVGVKENSALDKYLKK